MGNKEVNSHHILNPLSLYAFAMTILSRLFKIEQLSAFLGTKQLVLNSICHLILENLILFLIVNYPEFSSM